MGEAIWWNLDRARAKRNFENNRNVYYFACDENYLGLYKCHNLSNCTGNVYSWLYTVISQLICKNYLKCAKPSAKSNRFCAPHALLIYGSIEQL